MNTHRGHSVHKQYDKIPFVQKFSKDLISLRCAKVVPPPYFNDLSQLEVFLIYNTIFATTKKCGISDDQNDFRSQGRTLFSAISPYQCQVQNLN